MICAECSTTFQSKQLKVRFCSPSCKRRWHKKQPVSVVCLVCKKIRAIRSDSSGATRCRDCATDAMQGAGNPAWKGGKEFIEGRFGRDKDGLSWKAQRKLAWERADNQCENPECESGPLRRRPDVHHIVPFRVSRSHALTNLKCLCQSCHLTEEPMVQGAWGGAAFKSTRPRTGTYCTECDRRVQGTPYTAIPGSILCRVCKGSALILRAKALRAEGKSTNEIADLLNVSYMGAFYYSRGKRSSTSSPA